MLGVLSSPFVRPHLGLSALCPFSFAAILLILHMWVYNHKTSDEFDFERNRANILAHRGRNVQNTKMAICHLLFELEGSDFYWIKLQTGF